MKPGNVIVTTHVEHRVPISPGYWNRYGYKAPKSKQFALLYLGNLKDGVVGNDLFFEFMHSLGWEPSGESPFSGQWNEWRRKNP